MVVRVSDKKQTYNNVTKLLVKPFLNYLDNIQNHPMVLWEMS